MIHFRHVWGYGHLISIVTVLLTLIFVTVLLRSKRPPASTWSWLTLVVLLPYIGIPLFLIFGIRKIRSQASRIHGLKNKNVFHFEPENDCTKAQQRIQRVLKVAGVAAPLFNTELKFLTQGESAFSSLMGGIEGAQKEIALATFILARDPSGTAVLEALTRKASQGVRVRLLLDAWGSSIITRPSLKGFGKAGGEWALFMPLFHLPFRGQDNLRNHRKLALFDRDRAWFGGMNIAREYLGPLPDPKRWRDLSVELEGESVSELAEIFDSDWATATHSYARARNAGERRGAEKPRRPQSGSHRVQIVRSGPDCLGDPIYDSLLEACFTATERLWIVTPYFIPDDALIKALTLARRRGVDVRIAVPKASNHAFADLCRGSYLRQLRDEGAVIHFFPTMNHSKMVLVDQEFCLVGSANFDLRSLLYNYELGVLLYSPSDIEKASLWAQELFAASSSGELLSAGVWRELCEGIGRLFGPLL